MSDIFPLFLHKASLNRQITGGSLTYPAVPIVPNLGHGNIKANTESEGSSKDGCHVDTCEVRVRVAAYKRERKIGFRLTVSLEECVVKDGGELSVVSKSRATEREEHVLPPWTS
jgi:hypothetical protein